MDGRDLQRCIGEARRGSAPRQGLAALWRGQGPRAGGSAEECLKAGRDPERRFEPLRRGLGQAEAPRR